MHHKSTRVISNSSNSVFQVQPRRERRLTLTKLGQKAVAWIDKTYPLQPDDEYLFVCSDCEQPLSECVCGSGR